MKQGSHIIFIARWYPSPVDPMLGLFVQKHALAAVMAGYRVTVVSVGQVKASEFKGMFRTSVTEREGLTEIYVSYRKAEGPAGMARQMIAWNEGVKKAVSLSGKPDLIHAHILTRAGAIAWWFARKFRIDFVITEHWSRYYNENMQFKGYLRERLTAFILSRAAGVTVVSNRLANAMRQRGLSFTADLIPNVVDTEMFKMPGTASKGFDIVSISCFEEKSKNLKLLIDAFTEFSGNHPHSRLIMIGDGADAAKIKDYAKKFDKVADRIFFTGTLESNALAEKLQQSSCLALTSNYETFGIVAYEAMSAGKPVIATDVADLSEFMQSSDGILIPVGNKQALIGALEEVYSNTDRFNGSYARLRVEETYSWKAVSNWFKDYYNRFIPVNS